MPDLSVSRQDVMARQVVRHPSQSSGLDSVDSSSHSNGHSSKDNIFQHDKQKMTMANSFFQAVIKGNVNKVRHQLNRGHNINSKNDYGMSPLVAALHIEDDSRRARMFLLLLEKGAFHRVRDERHGRPVLHWACMLGQTEQVTTLLEETAGDINLSDKDKEGFTALHHAVKIGSLPISQSLVDYHTKFGVSVDIPDKLGLTPYIHARRLGYRDVASVLREQGFASIGHGDNLFRSPREWSQIGKFERKKAIELSINDQVNAAKIMGKLGLARFVSNTPRMAVPGIVVPSFVPDNRLPRNSVGVGRKAPKHISVSLPSINDAITEEAGTPRPMSTEKGTIVGDNESNGGSVTHRPGPPKIAFENESNKSSVNTYNSSQHRFFMSQKLAGITRSTDATANGPSESMEFQGNVRGLINPLRPLPEDNVVAAQSNALQRTNFAPPLRTNSNMAALNLLEQSSYQRGRLAGHFHQSHFDESKASEYGHMMGNLNKFMDVLSQQNTKSFRQSVPQQVKKPETPPKKKKKSKVSTMAIIFGKNRNSKRKGSRSPKSPKTPRQKGRESDKSKVEKKQDTSSKNTPKPKMGKANKLPVPSIKIN